MIRGERNLLATTLCCGLLAACGNHELVHEGPAAVAESWNTFPLSPEKEVDILFVVDNSGSMRDEQENLAQNFPRLIDSLRSHKLGPDGSGKPCTPQDQSGCTIPNVHIGVVSTDLGVGNYSIDSCQTPGGDGGILLTAPQGAGCGRPADSYISYVDGATNISGTTSDPIQQVKEAFSCIAQLGTLGCGFEHTLEAARRALSPGHNPGFLRPDALLAVVFITDEDDCSAARPGLFDPTQNTSTDPLGALHSFRCFDFGISCDIDDRDVVGPRKDCKPSGDWLHEVEQYIGFFRDLKPERRIILSAIAGPPDNVRVGRDGTQPVLQPSCQSGLGKADPAIRLEHVVTAFGSNGHFSSICDGDFGPALERLGERILGSIDQCLDSLPLTQLGGVACGAGLPLGPGQTCAQDCLDRAECVVSETSGYGDEETHALVPRCPVDLFRDPSRTDCGSACPCWRLITKATCAGSGPGLALDIVRQGDPPRGALAHLKCQASLHPFGSDAFAALPVCR